MLRVLDQANDPGQGRDSEDRPGCRPADGIAWIIDGATDKCATRLFPAAPSDAFWFAEAGHDLLETLPPGPPEAMVGNLLTALRDRVEAAIGRPADTIPPGDRPGAAITVLKVDPETKRLEFASFPDCTALVLPPDGPGFAIPDASSPQEEQELARRLLATGADVAAALRSQRAARPPTHPILSVHPEALAALHRHGLAAPPGTRVLLCTDGLYRLVDMYGLLDDDGLIRAALDDGLTALVARLRDFEADAAEDARYGRFKTSDDAAGLLVEVA